MLEKYLSNRKTWFALVQIDDPTYQKFYRYRPEGTTLILDNGVYEGEMNLPKYNTAIYFYNPEVVVLPDIYLGDSERSLHLSLGFLEQCGLSKGEYRNEWMFVPQAKPGDVEGFVKAAFTALKDPRVTWIGIPRCLTTDISDNPLARPNFAKSILQDYPHVKIHALGMINGCIPELYYLQKAGVLSCDSSWPFNHGVADSNLEAIDQCLITP
jgi:hypothetical protein